MLTTILLSALLAITPSHDIASLQNWGPYSKEYFGISHIADLSSGIQVEFCLVPGVYRRNVKVPCALFESDVHPWCVSPDMKHITYRQEIEWKDKVYVDATYHIMDDNHVLLESRCVNNTDIVQNISLQLAVRKSGGIREMWTPELKQGDGWFTVTYPEVETTYGVVWDNPLSEVRQWRCAKLEQLMPRKVHDHVFKDLKGDREGHYTANFLRPVVLQPQKDTTVWQLIVCGNKEKVVSELQSQSLNTELLTQSVCSFSPAGRSSMSLNSRQLGLTADKSPFPFGII